MNDDCYQRNVLRLSSNICIKSCGNSRTVLKYKNFKQVAENSTFLCKNDESRN